MTSTHSRFYYTHEDPTPPLMSNPSGRNLAGVLSKIKPEVQSSPLELPTVRVVIR